MTDEGRIKFWRRRALQKLGLDLILWEEEGEQGLKYAGKGEIGTFK